MLKILCQNHSTLVLKHSDPNKIVESVKEYIKTTECNEITIDISGINLIDACKITVLCSTEHYLKNTNSKINWIVASDSIEKMISSMGLGNSSFIYK